MKIYKWTFLIIIAINLYGCYFMEFIDISNEKDIAPLIGSKYETINELFIYGITLDKNYKKVIDYYTVKNPPGISGPEVISKNTLPKGTLIKIIKAERCNNCLPFSAKERLIVEILTNDNFSNAIVVLSYGKININNDDSFIKIDETHNKAINIDRKKRVELAPQLKR